MYFNYKEITASEGKLLKIHGRSLFEDKIYLSWSNSGVELNFEGRLIEFNFEEYLCEQPVYVKSYTEKGEQRFGLLGALPKVILEFDNEGVHTVKLLRISEGNVPLVLRSIKIMGDAPEFLPPPPEKKLRLEFLGDSITAGYGVLASADQDKYYTCEQDSTRAYAYLTAELLDAEIRTEAYSGQGVYRNCGGQEGYQFKRIFDMAIRVMDGYDHSKWTPDAMILHCGTNDVPGGTDEETMYKEAGFLIDKVRAVYPRAKIVWMYGMMNSKFHGTFEKLISDRNRAGDADLYYFPTEEISRAKNEFGAAWHPNVNASQKVSAALAEFLKALL